MMAKKGIVNIHGKEYKTVIMRVNEFRAQCPAVDGWAIRTWLISNEGDRVIIQASICDKDDHVVATGFAEEDRNSSAINKTSALEVAETSAIGRALSAWGLGGEEYCSANELMGALAQQENLPAAPAPDPTPPPATEKKDKPLPGDSFKKRIADIEGKIGKEACMSWWLGTMKHNPDKFFNTDSLAQIGRLTTAQQWETLGHFDKIYKEQLEAIEAGEAE